MLELFKVFNPVIISVVSVFGGAAIKFYFDAKTIKKKYDFEKLENITLKDEIQDKSLSIQMELQMLNDIKEIVESVLYKTNADRFLILSATNGRTNLRFATAIYEQHKNTSSVVLSIGATGKYVKFEFDSEYKKMLKDCELNSCVELDVEKMPPSDLRYIYESEKINFSNVYFLMRGKIDELNDRLFYCSVSTHDKRKFDKKESLIIKVAIDKLKSKFLEYEKNN
jgi:hypothetical protein